MFACVCQHDGIALVCREVNLRGKRGRREDKEGERRGEIHISGVLPDHRGIVAVCKLGFGLGAIFFLRLLQSVLQAEVPGLRGLCQWN